MGLVWGGWSQSRKNVKDVIINYVNRLFSCNQHFQLLLSKAPRNA